MAKETRSYPTQEELRLLFTYENGNLYWKFKIASKIIVGSLAGNKGDRYWGIGIKGRRYNTHRLIWIFHNGSIPKGFEIDHKNQIKTDNRIENLRLATHQLNKMNVSFTSHNASGYKGVFWNTQKKKWAAAIHIQKKTSHIGFFDKKEDAAMAYIKKSVEIYGEYSSEYDKIHHITKKN